MTRLARIAFGVLVIATLGAFVVTQKLKSSPNVIIRPLYSPAPVLSTAPGAHVTTVDISFWITHSDDVNISIVDGGGNQVRTLAQGVHLPHNVRIHRRWNGRDGNGHPVPDGQYQVRVALIHQGRTVDLPQTITVDTRPPTPRVTSIEPRGATGPAFLPQPGVRAATIHLAGTEGRQARLEIWRTDVYTPRRVGAIAVPAGRTEVAWDGTLDGKPAPPGTYLMGVAVADRAGNSGTFPPRLPPKAGAVPGRAGITVRALAAAPPSGPLAPGATGTVYVDARGHAYDWALRRLGDAKKLTGGRGHGRDAARLRIRIPRAAQPGLYTVTLVAGGARTQVPLTVDAGSRSRPVLVVLPAITWQGLNPVDDDGDGMPDTLDDGAPSATAALVRPYAHGLPASIATREGALLQALDANLLHYDVTTDAALSNGAGPRLDGHRGVILAGDERWITPGLSSALRTYVQGGGRVWSLGVDALRRTVQLQAGTLSHPSPPSIVDALGARPQQPLVQAPAGQPAAIVDFAEGSLGLFTNTSGRFPGYTTYEALAPFAAPAQLDAAAGPDGTPVIASWRLGDGWVVHTGLPELAAKARADDTDARALLLQLWTLLSAR